jgi:hypothetical protein
MAQDDARHGFDFEIKDRLALGRSKVADLLLREIEIGPLLFAQTIDTGLDFLVVEPIAITIQAVEFDAQRPDRSISTFANFAKQGLHSFRYRRIARLALRNAGRFDVTDHGMSY